jgi:ABC-type transport system involved in multi-copper enzyme maturation permease subunit
MIVWAIARNTFREAIRDRILYGLLAFAMLLIGCSVALADLSIGQQERLMKDIGLAAISAIGVLMAVFLGITLVSKEIERRTVYTILSKPVRRYQLILGKYLGLAATLALNVLVMGVGLSVLLAAYGWWQPNVAAALLLVLVELLVVTAVATLFSSFTTPTLAAIFTLGLFVIGHLSGTLRLIAQRAPGELARLVAGVLYRVLPNLEAFNVKGRVAHGEPVALVEVGLAGLYGALYLAAVLALAAVVFERRELR